MLADDFVLIPYIPLTSKQKQDYLTVAVKGNLLLKKYHAEIFSAIPKGKGTGKVKYSRAKFRTELFKALDGEAKTVTVRGVTIPKDASKAILEVKKVEWPLLCSVSRLIEKQARLGFARKPMTCELGLEDFYNEAVAIAIHSVYLFAKIEIQFSTYLVNNINRRLSDVMYMSKPLSHWTQAGQCLDEKYESIRKTFNGPATFDEIVEKMKLSDKDRSTLQSTMVKVVRESEIPSSENEGERVDYTSLGDLSQPEKLDFEQLAAIKNAPLDAWERAVLEAFVSAPFGSNGWKTEVASKFINPSTGKSYTRAAPALAMKRIREKILAQYQKEKAKTEAA